MNIAHVFPLFSSTGESGGPASVALGQARELARRGHKVTVFAAADVPHAQSATVDGYELSLFPRSSLVRRFGFAGFRARGMLSSIQKRLSEFDIVHVHVARDLVTLPVAFIAQLRGVPTVLQTHGMIDPSDRKLAKALDLVVTKRVLRNAKRVLSLTAQEDADLVAVERQVVSTRVRNGIEVGEVPSYSGRKPEVLFLARLHERKRPVDFVRIAAALRDELSSVQFTLVGPDGGEGARVDETITELGLRDCVAWTGPIAPAEVPARMATAQVYVLPAVDEVFPMSMLEAFQSGTPVVTTNSLGIAEDCVRYEAAVICEPDVDALAAGVRRALDPEISAALRRGAETYLRTELNIRDVVNWLENEYVSVARLRDGLLPTGVSKTGQ